MHSAASTPVAPAVHVSTPVAVEIGTSRVLVLCTLDHEHFILMDISDCLSPALLRQTLCKRFSVPDWERTQVFLEEMGEGEKGEPLDDERLLELCKKGDAKGSLKLYIRCIGPSYAGTAEGVYGASKVQSPKLAGRRSSAPRSPVVQPRLRVNTQRSDDHDRRSLHRHHGSNDSAADSAGTVDEDIDVSHLSIDPDAGTFPSRRLRRSSDLGYRRKTSMDDQTDRSGHSPSSASPLTLSSRADSSALDSSTPTLDTDGYEGDDDDAAAANDDQASPMLGTAATPLKRNRVIITGHSADSESGHSMRPHKADRQDRKYSSTGESFKVIRHQPPQKEINFDKGRISPYDQRPQSKYQFVALRTAPPPPPNRTASKSSAKSFQVPRKSMTPVAEAPIRQLLAEHQQQRQQATVDGDAKDRAPSVAVSAPTDSLAHELLRADAQKPESSPMADGVSDELFKENAISFADAPSFPDFGDDTSDSDDGLWAKKPPSTASTASSTLVKGDADRVLAEKGLGIDVATSPAPYIPTVAERHDRPQRPPIRLQISTGETVRVHHPISAISENTESASSATHDVPYPFYDMLTRNSAADIWAVRPPAEVVYDNLEKYFPNADLDKPIIDDSEAAGWAGAAAG
ncbi:uncharacterized protein V1510DRAFT_392794, partial [Dipodascopsis tothii]|uniref:uncharacterized protein n=1 Tax=Dipodascopsis tothii TaxID=44089 RepID=UPI0034D020C0